MNSAVLVHWGKGTMSFSPSLIFKKINRPSILSSPEVNFIVCFLARSCGISRLDRRVSVGMRDVEDDEDDDDDIKQTCIFKKNNNPHIIKVQVLKERVVYLNMTV